MVATSSFPLGSHAQWGAITLAIHFNLQTMVLEIIVFICNPFRCCGFMEIRDPTRSPWDRDERNEKRKDETPSYV